MARTTQGTPQMPPAVNLHFWQPCNMRCSFCFARFEDVRAALPPGHLPEGEALELTHVLASRFDKMTFAGGEATLCPWLPALVRKAKQRGTTTMLVTNGTRLSEAYLSQFEGSLDWITLSVDSGVREVNRALKRAVNGHAFDEADYVRLADLIRAAGIRLKVNTVVNSLNGEQDLTGLLLRLRPEHWKPLQVLPVGGQNDRTVGSLLITSDQFARFIDRHRDLEASGIIIRAEANEDMTGSYAMTDPAGRFFDNTAGRHTYSRPILAVGVEEAWSDVTFMPERFSARGGLYQWKLP